MTDSRVPQVAALVDDARCTLVDMSYERDLPEHLRAALFSLNVAVRHLEIHRRLNAPDGAA